MYPRLINKLTLFVVIATSFCQLASSQQIPDRAYHYKIIRPAYKQKLGSLILFDEAHGNPVSLKGLYFGFNKLLTEDGYLLSSAKTEINRDILKKAKIFVSVNAMSDPADWDAPTRSAYAETEIATLNQWVKAGGSLFLVTDHMPCGGSVNSLAQSFGFNIINGFAIRHDRKPEIFSLKQGNLCESVITKATGGKVESIRIWGGTAFVPPANAMILSTLSADYTIYSPLKVDDIDPPLANKVPRVSGLGFANGAFMKYGKGRIVVFADGAGFTAQLEGIKSEKRGMNDPTAPDNAQFLLNIIHWLDGVLEGDE